MSVSPVIEASVIVAIKSAKILVTQNAVGLLGSATRFSQKQNLTIVIAISSTGFVKNLGSLKKS